MTEGVSDPPTIQGKRDPPNVDSGTFEGVEQSIEMGVEHAQQREQQTIQRNNRAHRHLVDPAGPYEHEADETEEDMQRRQLHNFIERQVQQDYERYFEGSEQSVSISGDGVPSIYGTPTTGRAYRNTQADTSVRSSVMQSDNISMAVKNAVESDEVVDEKQRSTKMAIFVGGLTALGGFLFGYDTGVINNILEMSFVKRTFSSNHTSFTAPESSIITAILSIGTCVGALISPQLSDRFGRRTTIIVSTAMIFNLGITLQVISSSIPLLCVGRFFSGWGVGIISAVVPLYQAETSPKWIRGSIISLYQWTITWGLLCSSSISQGTHDMNSASCYRIPIGVQLAPSTFLAICMYFLPESPRYFIRSNRLDDAIVALSRLRRLAPESPALIEELIEIKAASDYEQSFGGSTLKDCFRDSTGRVSQRKRMFTGIMLQVLQQCSGINFIFYYGVNYFVSTGLSNSYLMSLVTYLTNMVFTVPGIFFVESLGRRTLLLAGSLGMTVCSLIIAIVGCTAESEVANKVMIVVICTFIAFFASTWGPTAWVVVGELYNLSVRQRAVSLCATANWIINFVFAYLVPYLINRGSHSASLGTNIFFLWAFFTFIGFVLTYYLVYETKGLMLEDIDELYLECNRASQSRKCRASIVARKKVAKDIGGVDTLFGNSVLNEKDQCIAKMGASSSSNTSNDKPAEMTAEESQPSQPSQPSHQLQPPQMSHRSQLSHPITQTIINAPRSMPPPTFNEDLERLPETDHVPEVDLGLGALAYGNNDESGSHPAIFDFEENSVESDSSIGGSSRQDSSSQIDT